MGCCTLAERKTKPSPGTGYTSPPDGGVAQIPGQQSQPLPGHRVSITQQPTNGAIVGSISRELPPGPSVVEDETQTATQLHSCLVRPGRQRI